MQVADSERLAGVTLGRALESVRVGIERRVGSAVHTLCSATDHSRIEQLTNSLSWSCLLRPPGPVPLGVLLSSSKGVLSSVDSVASELSLEATMLESRAEMDPLLDEARVLGVLCLSLRDPVPNDSGSSSLAEFSWLLLFRELIRLLAISSSTSHPKPSTSHPPATPIPSTSLTALLPSVGIAQPTATGFTVCIGDSGGGEIGGDRKTNSRKRVVALLFTLWSSAVGLRGSFEADSPSARHAPADRCGGKAAIV
jgi:hypothetical protein